MPSGYPDLVAMKGTAGNQGWICAKLALGIITSSLSNHWSQSWYNDWKVMQQKC